MTGDYSDFIAKSIMDKLEKYTNSCQIELKTELLGDFFGGGGGVVKFFKSLKKYCKNYLYN